MGEPNKVYIVSSIDAMIKRKKNLMDTQEYAVRRGIADLIKVLNDTVAYLDDRQSNVRIDDAHHEFASGNKEHCSTSIFNSISANLEDLRNLDEDVYNLEKIKAGKFDVESTD